MTRPLSGDEQAVNDALQKKTQKASSEDIALASRCYKDLIRELNS